MSMLALTVAVPLLLKSSGSGFVHPNWARSEKCEVFDNRVEMTRTYARDKFEYVFPMQSDSSLEEMIEKASAEKVIQEPNYLCDGPSTFIKANINKDGVDHELVLYSTGGCGSPKIVRQGPHSNALMDIAGTFCPTTH